MQRLNRFKQFAPLFALVLLLATARGIWASGGVHWDHDEHGADWAELIDPVTNSHPFEACDDPTTGGAIAHQSPVDIERASLVPAHVSNIGFQYRFVPVTISNTGHTIEVSPGADTSNKLIFNNETYILKQYHLHSDSEHTFDGEHKDLELHFVHEKVGSTDKLVVTVIIDASARSDNQSLQPLISRLAYLQHEGDTLPSASQPTQILDHPGYLIPEVGGPPAVQDRAPFPYREYYTYVGSLTTPPCSGNVRFIIMKNTIPMSYDQLHKLRTVESARNNYRLVQPLNGRSLQRHIP